jgi:hypothetical protein
VERKADGVVAGTVILVPLPDGNGEVEVGWHFHPDSWGSGFATESAAAVVGWAFSRGLDEVLSVVRPDNAASLAVCGLRLEDVQQVAVAGVPDAIRALVEGRAVAASTMLGIPALREAHATVPGGLRVLTLGPDESPITDMPGFEAVEIQPGPAMAGILKPTRVTRMDVYLNTNVHVSADDVYAVVRTFHQHWSELQKSLPAFRSVQANEIAPVRLVHPYHEGAVRYYKEAGLWTDEHERLQRSLEEKP